MQTPPFTRLLGAIALLSAAVASGQAHAATFAFSGNLVMNNDLVNVDFTVSGATGTVDLWTDSFQSGANFDPQLTLWRQTGSDYVLVANNDDDDSIHAGQGYQDAGLSAALSAGTYRLTLSASSYQAAGTLLSQGFEFDPFFIPALTPTPIASWNQPSYDPNLNNQKGTFWSVSLSGQGIDSAAISPVPEPATVALLAAGLIGIGLARARQVR